MTVVKSIKVLTRSGLNILAPVQCITYGGAKCRNLTERKCCRIWAFPESKWNGDTGCPDYHPAPD